MRFLLLARGRSTGRVRLLSERAFDTRAEAVDAAAITAAGLDLSDDEVLSVDLDGAGPVLVLRVGVPDAAAATYAARPAPPLRPQPRFPLFGASEEDSLSDEDLADTLRRVALRMEADLGGVGDDDTDRFTDDWDARTHHEYALPDDGSLDVSREEGRSRIEAADAVESGREVAFPDESSLYAEEPIPDGWWISLESDSGVADDGTDGASDTWVAVADPAEGLTTDWQPPTTYYRPANTDFAVWVCGDCVYQRTCRKAGAATPSSCGNFLWRSH